MNSFVLAFPDGVTPDAGAFTQHTEPAIFLAHYLLPHPVPCSARLTENKYIEGLDYAELCTAFDLSEVLQSCTEGSTSSQ